MAQNGVRGGRGQHGGGDESDVNERREIRRNYRELIARAQSKLSSLGHFMMHDVQNFLLFTIK